MPQRRILIVGGSTRAAADSVRRAGWQPVCADLFADLDLHANAEVVPVRNYPESLPDDVAHIRADGWFYCGGLENHPDILDRIEIANTACGPLLGTHLMGLRIVREPLWLADILKSSGIKVLDVAPESSPPLADGTWVQKPKASAGGRAIRIWDDAALKVPLSEPHYFQRRAAGTAQSAIFCADGGEIRWLGASLELEPNPGSEPPSVFSYCGSCGPTNHIPQQLEEIAATLLRRIPALRGPIGLDFRLDRNNVWLTEVNPRYTASIEILELASGRSLLNPNAELPPKPDSQPQGLLVAKQILYTSKQICAPDLSRFANATNVWQVPIVSDIPRPGIPIEPGWPICTVFASGNTRREVDAILNQRSDWIRHAIHGETDQTLHPLK